MPKTYTRLASVVALSSVMTGCSWYSQLSEPTTDREARIGRYEAEPKDAYSKKFDELQLRIEALERENSRLRSPKSRRANLSSAVIVPHKISEPKGHDNDGVIEQVKLKVSQAILAIDNVLSQLSAAEVASNQPSAVRSPEPRSIVSESSEAMFSETMLSESSPSAFVPSEPELVASLTSPNSVSGVLGRNDDGDVVSSTTYLPGTGPSYNFSVVYTYPAVEPWNQMWQVLDDANEQDKWKGVNQNKPSYFIYVGAYVNELDAMNRQNNLLSITGEEPVIRKRAINRAVAAN